MRQALRRRHERDRDSFSPVLEAEGDDELDRSLRPRTLDEFVGQERLQEQLDDRARGRAWPRARRSTTCCWSGRPGSARRASRTSIREELGVGIRSVAGPALERKGDLAAILTALDARDVLFVDEIHRLAPAVEEILYPALEDFRLDIVVGQGPAARTLTLDLPPFTLVGATTRTGLLTTPLRDRFGMTFRLDYYEPDELAAIVRRSARILGVEIADDAAERDRARARAARRASPTGSCAACATWPRCATPATITTEVADEALELLEVDGEGLERIDRELLEAIATKFDGGPVGLSTLAVSLGEEPDTIEDVYEPYLLQLGFIQRTPRGRVITEARPRARRGDDRRRRRLF